MLPDIKQYINWRIEQRPEPTKVPFDPATGNRIDHLNPANWKTRAEAEATGAAVGFVLTSNDPYFCVDLDNVVDNGQWTPMVAQVYALFPDAFCELSVSGTGLHIWGIGTPPENHRSKWTSSGHKLEFYSRDRFIALGRPLGGTFGKYDYSQALQQFVPVQQFRADDVELTDQTDPRYTGPQDDDELIKAMLSAPGSAASLFGDRASLADLWHGDVTKLARFFPSERDEFDRSSADAALCVHLAFWAGRNPARIDRLFRRSGLMRDKWNRPDYLKNTVGKAVTMQQRVYDRVREVPRDDSADDAGDTLSETFLSADEMRTFFAGHVKLPSIRSVFCPDGRVYKAESFKDLHGKYSFKLDLSNRKVVKDAYKAITQCEFLDVPTADATCFRPDLPTGEIVNRHGIRYVNTYVPAEIETVEGDVTPFLRHMELLLPDIRDRQIVLTYMASLVRNPGVKFRWCPVIQGVQGNGKSTLFQCLEESIGEHFTCKPNPAELGGKFNSYLRNKLIVGVEEVHISERREIIDNIKIALDAERIQFEAKGENAVMDNNLSNWFMTTNHRDAIPKTKNDRRFAVFFTAQQQVEDLARDGMDSNYFRRLNDWLRKDNGYAKVAHYLRNVELIAEFDPATNCLRAPETSSMGEAINESRGAIEQEIFEAIESERRGFKGGFIGSGTLEKLMREHKRNVSPRAKGAAMSNLGYTVKIRASKQIMEEGEGRVLIYMKPDHPLASETLPTVVTEQFMTTQGYSGAMNMPATNVLTFPRL